MFLALRAVHYFALFNVFGQVATDNRALSLESDEHFLAGRMYIEGIELSGTHNDEACVKSGLADDNECLMRAGFLFFSRPEQKFLGGLVCHFDRSAIRNGEVVDKIPCTACTFHKILEAVCHFDFLSAVFVHRLKNVIISVLVICQRCVFCRTLIPENLLQLAQFFTDPDQSL